MTVTISKYDPPCTFYHINGRPYLNKSLERTVVNLCRSDDQLKAADFSYRFRVRSAAQLGVMHRNTMTGNRTINVFHFFKEWIPIVIALLALFVSYLSFKNTINTTRPFLRVKYVVVEKSNKQDLNSILGRREFLDSAYFDALRKAIGGKVNIADTDVISNSTPFKSYGNIKLLLVENVGQSYIGSIKAKVIENSSGIGLLMNTAEPNRNFGVGYINPSEKSKTITFDGLKPHELLAIPLELSKFSESVTKINDGSDLIISLRVKRLNFSNENNSESYELIPRPMLETPLFVANKQVTTGTNVTK